VSVQTQAKRVALKKKAKSDSVPGDSAELEPRRLPFKKGFFRDWFEVVMYGLALLMFLKGFVFQNFQIPTKSMENSLLIGDHLMANKFMFGHTQWDWEEKILPHREIQRGDVVVFKYPRDVRQDYIKRCIGLPGEQFQIIKDQVYIDGEPIDESYTYYKQRTDGPDRDPENRFRPLYYDELNPGLGQGYHYPRNNNFVRVDANTRTVLGETLRSFQDFQTSPHPKERAFYDQLKQFVVEYETGGKATIPEDFYIMMGDNRNLSADSRFWGLVPRAYVEGRAYFVWWSYGEDENSHMLRGWDLIMSYARVPLTFWTRTHWKESWRRIK